MKELKKPNGLESTYSELELQMECSDFACPQLSCVCKGNVGFMSPEGEDEIILA